MINVVIVIIGMLMDDVSSVLLASPLLLPIAMKLGVDPIHFAAIIGVNLGMGNVTPPTAPLLYLGAGVVLVEVCTDEGVSGYGESIATPSAEAICTYLSLAADLCIGRSPFENARLVGEAVSKASRGGPLATPPRRRRLGRLARPGSPPSSSWCSPCRTPTRIASRHPHRPAR